MDNLKVRIDALKEKGYISYSPDRVHVWLNDQPIVGLQKLVLTVDKDGIPAADITLTLESIDIDVDTLTALHAFLKNS